jgi:hypothetical protein
MRVATRILCAVLAIAIAAASVVAMVEVALALAGRGPWLVDARPWFDDLSGAPWASPTHRLVLLLALAAGIALLAVAWAPRRPVTLPMADERLPDGIEVDLRRAEVERRLAASAREVPYVVDASARADSAVTVVVGSTRPSDESVRRQVEEAVRGAADRLGLEGSSTRIKVRASSGRAA